MDIINTKNVNGDLSPLSNIDGNINGLSNIKGNMTYGLGYGTRDYNKLLNKPQIESVELVGNKTFSDLGLETLDAIDILSILT